MAGHMKRSHKRKSRRRSRRTRKRRGGNLVKCMKKCRDDASKSGKMADVMKKQVKGLAAKPLAKQMSALKRYEKAAMKQTAGGTDIEEGYGEKIIFKGKEIDEDTIEYDMQDYSDLIFVLEDGIKYTDGTPVAEEDYDALHEEYDLIEWVRIDYADRVAPQYEGMDSFVNPNDQDATRSKTNVSTKDLDSEDMTEVDDIDTGKQALKAERDPMLERILYLAKG